MKGRLLLVEDDPALTDLLKWHFEREDFDVEHTVDGEEALLLAAESPPDIILLDWMIEGISGIEVCRRLRRAPETANVPIIMLTGRGEEADRVRAIVVPFLLLVPTVMSSFYQIAEVRRLQVEL